MYVIHTDCNTILSLVDKGWPVVLLDVDSKQSESALRGPPPTFVTEDFLKALRYIIHPRGMYVCALNIVELIYEIPQLSKSGCPPYWK